MLQWIVKLLNLRVDRNIKIGKNPKIALSFESYEGFSDNNYCRLRFRKEGTWTPFVLKWDKDR